MPGFDLIWLIFCGIYVFQLRREKGILYEKMVGIAAKKQNFDKGKFIRMQYFQIALVTAIIIGFRVFPYFKSH